ncbi:MAG: hypothetical protein CME90_11085 [Hoeflea sp.]|nr:hypothetical protein [Hoeflea sp.]|tara:strand:+ start:14016 stop:14312 length:297 start_codon:yes stop_codon:yes gene_type:complete
MSYEEHLQADARLTILKELSRQTDGRLNETVLTAVLDAFGYRKSRDWVRTQLRALEDIGAITLAQAGTVFIASITRAGQDHVDRRTILEGVQRPSPEV